MSRHVAMVACALFAALLPASAFAYTPGSGDVDEDGRLTTRDAARIVESLQWPERDRLFDFLAACDVTGDGRCDMQDAEAIMRAVVRDPNDFDGDGVPNDQDCAPYDDRLAVEHTFYMDGDRDQIGDSNRPVRVCSVTPLPPLVAWGGDPDDTSAYAQVPPRPKGARVLGVDFADAGAAGYWRPDLAKEVGADATSLRLAWRDLEPSPGQYAGGDALRLAATTFRDEGFTVSLTVSPISGSLLAVPEDLRAALASGALRFSDRQVIERFEGMLAFVHAQLADLPLVSLQIGYEVDGYLSRQPVQAWSDFGAFFFEVSGFARALWGAQQLQVGTTATLASLLDPVTRGQLLAINGSADIVSFTYLPRAAGSFFAIEPEQVRVEVETVISLYYPKPLHADAVAFPTAAVTGSSETKQSQFVRALFDVWDAWPLQISYVNFSRLFDLNTQRAGSEAQTWGGGPVAAAWFQTLGLRTGDGTDRPKTAYRTLLTQTLNRGWVRDERRPTRKFELGFTPAPYDAPQDPAGLAAMHTWLQNEWAADATIMNVHLDSGVPWVEALADTFSSPDLPYSPAMRAHWSDLRASLPPGVKRLVSINPLGIPRNVIAPYFGYGQGFSYAEADNFRRVPNGVFMDGENRMPPPPWDGYQFDDPNVKRAFVNYAKRAIQFFQPDYLIVAIETTATLLASRDTFDHFLELQKYVYRELKADPATSHVPILVSVSATSFVADEYGVPLKFEEQSGQLRELQFQGLRDLLPYVDMVALSNYPHYGKYNSTLLLGSMYDDLLHVLEKAGKPIGVSEGGWVAETFDLLGLPFFSSNEKQDLYLSQLFTSLERTPLPVEFVVNFSARDNDGIWNLLRQGSLTNPPSVSPLFVEFYKYFRDIGLFDGSGQPRPSWNRWREMRTRPYEPVVP